MHFGKIFLTASSLVAFIVVPNTTSVNRNPNAIRTPVKVRVADGMPLPLPHGPQAVLSADGMPLPLPHGPGVTLLTDGMPLPIPHA